MPIRIRIRPWYVVLVFRVPWRSEPACLGLGLDAHRAEARSVAERLACEVAS